MGQRPTYNVEDFQAIFPMGPKTCPIRKVWHQGLVDAIKDPELMEEMEQMIKVHDETWNTRFFF